MPLPEESIENIDAHLERDPSLKSAVFICRILDFFASTRMSLTDKAAQDRVENLFTSCKRLLRRVFGLTTTQFLR